MMRPRCTCLCLTAAALIASPAGSVTRTVRSQRDSGSGSLRVAIQRATSGDTILLRVRGTIVLSRELVLDKNVTLRGLPAGKVTLSGNGATRILRVAVGVTAAIEGLNLNRGAAVGHGDGAGGAILNAGSLSVRDCIVDQNVSDRDGGAIWNSGTLALDGVWVFRSLACNNGGAIYNAGVLQVTRSTLSGNFAGIGAGAIYNEGEVNVDASAVSENDADSNGAIANFGLATISNSTVTHNHATADVGGIGNWSELHISNSTLSRNRSDFIGAIGNDGQVSLRSSTLVENHASDGVGGIQNSGALTMANTIVARNQAGSANRPGPDILGEITSLGHNLIGDTNDAGGFVASDLLNVDPQLGPLQDNGGYTATHALMTGSPAIDAGNDALVDPSVTTDQRGSGFLRFFDGDGDGRAAVDIGAVEHQGADLALSKQVTSGKRFSAGVIYTLTVRNLGPELGEAVVITDALPSGAAFISASTTQGTLSTPPPGGAGTVTANLGPLPPGASARVRITIRVSRRQVSNTARVSAASFDPRPGNNDDTAGLRR